LIFKLVNAFFLRSNQVYKVYCHRVVPFIAVEELLLDERETSGYAGKDSQSLTAPGVT